MLQPDSSLENGSDTLVHLSGCGTWTHPSNTPTSSSPGQTAGAEAAGEVCHAAQETPAAAVSAARPVSSFAGSHGHAAWPPMQDEQKALGGRSNGHTGALQRLSLAHMGLMAAPGAAVLPGSPLNTGTTTAGSAGVLAWDAAGSKALCLGDRCATQAMPSVTYSTGSWHKNTTISSAAASGSILASTSTTGTDKGSTQDNKPGPHHKLSANSSSSSTPTASDAGQQPGTAAFKGPSRSQAAAAGRFSTAAHMGAPGPGQFRVQHAAVDKHVPGVCWAGSSRQRHPVAAGKAPQQLTAPQGGRKPTGTANDSRPPDNNKSGQQLRIGTHNVEGYRASTATTHAGLSRHSSTCVGHTPRSAAEEGDYDVALLQPQPGVAGKQQQLQHHSRLQQQQQSGTAAFKVVSQDQRAALGMRQSGAGGSSSVGPGCQQAGCGVRAPPSRGLEFSKQTHRPPPSAPTASPAALGPGAYFRSGPLPLSFTGNSLAAGHDHNPAAPDFSRTTCRPATSNNSSNNNAGSGTCTPNRVWGGLLDMSSAGPDAAGIANEEGGLWVADCCSSCQNTVGGWASAGRSLQGGCISGAPGGAGSCSQTRPSSAALDYARRQHGATVLVPAAGAAAGWPADAAGTQQLATAAATVGAACSMATEPRPQIHGHGLAASRQTRPISAGPVLTRSAGAAASQAASQAGLQRTVYSRPFSGSQLHRHHAGPGVQYPVGCVLGAADLQRFSSTDLASRVKGGKFSASSRAVGSAAAAAVTGAGVTELLYDPEPEVQGHVRRAPCWSLPPNTVATSKKWAKLAAQAALQ